MKALLLMQYRCPGIGNWMAEEILWRARLNPKTRAGTLSLSEINPLYRVTRSVCAKAIEVMDKDWQFPRSWLFAHRWEDGGKCPRCRTDLMREVVGGRRTCWCPQCQPEHAYDSSDSPLESAIRHLSCRSAMAERRARTVRHFVEQCEERRKLLRIHCRYSPRGERVRNSPAQHSMRSGHRWRHHNHQNVAGRSLSCPPNPL